LTKHVTLPDKDNELKILAFDSEPYYFCLSICEELPPVKLLQNFIHDELSSEGDFEKLSLEESVQKAKSFTKQATLMIADSDDEQSPQDESGGKFVFSLTDPWSKRIISSLPVRGKKCKHYQVRQSQHSSLFSPNLDFTHTAIL
jgi:hypothetical protein